jgi:hypothetical protein
MSGQAGPSTSGATRALAVSAKYCSGARPPIEIYKLVAVQLGAILTAATHAGDFALRERPGG